MLSILGLGAAASVELKRRDAAEARIACAEARAEEADRSWRAQVCAAYRQDMAIVVCGGEQVTRLNWEGWLWSDGLVEKVAYGFDTRRRRRRFHDPNFFELACSPHGFWGYAHGVIGSELCKASADADPC